MKENSVKNNLPKDIGIWIRVSSEDQARGESPAHHLERARHSAAGRGWNVKEVYDLAGISGKSVKDHPECKRMMADIKRGHISGLMFSKLARLARNTTELLEFSDYFQVCKADLISLSENIDTSSPAGRLFFTIIAAMATWEREEIADRQKASVLIRAKLGKTINGKAPFGYQWKDRKLVIHPDEGPVRRRAYELFLQYRRKGTVAKLLTAEGHRSREGAIIRDCNITRMLTCPSAKGVYYFNRARKTGSWTDAEKPESEWGKAECPPLVSEDVWNQVNQIIEEGLKQWKRPGKVPVNPFGNRLWCQCGSRMYERKNIRKFQCRACNRKVPVEGLAEFMREELHQFYGSPQQVAVRLEDAKKNLVETEAALTSLQRQIQGVREDMNQTRQLLRDKLITPQGFSDLYNPDEQRLNQLLGGLPRLEADVARLRVNQVSVEEVVHEARTLYEQWPKLNDDRKRTIVETVFERIELKDGENGAMKIAITYSGLPSSEELCNSQQRTAPATC
jgi:site-specific DNA recombinase